MWNKLVLALVGENFDFMDDIVRSLFLSFSLSLNCIVFLINFVFFSVVTVRPRAVAQAGEEHAQALESHVDRR